MFWTNLFRFHRNHHDARRTRPAANAANSAMSTAAVFVVVASVLGGGGGLGCESGVAATDSNNSSGKAGAQPAAPVQLAQSDEEADLLNQRAELNSPIRADNIAADGMQLAWKVETDNPVSHRPLTGDGRVFFADWGGNVYAVDASSGSVAWKKQIEQPKTMWPWHGFAGSGVLGGGLLFEASVEGNAFALDPRTGQVVWQTRITDDEQAGSICDLLYHDGKVFIGLQSVEEPLTKEKPDFKPDFQGKVIALDAKTGKTAWQRPLVEPPHNGCAVWCSFALDPQTNTLFFATGNNYTGEATELSDSVIAVDAGNGNIRWAKQATHHDIWTGAEPKGPDCDFGAGPQLFEGGGRALVGIGQKSGIFWALDRQTGEVVWTTPVGYGGVCGGIHAECSIGDGVVYTWSNNSYSYGADPEKHPANIKALDAATGKPLWVQINAQPADIEGASYLAGDVFFLPSLDGHVRAYRTSDGKQIWKSPDYASVLAPLTVSGNTLLFATGNPKHFGTNKGATGVFAYTAAAGGSEAGQQRAVPAAHRQPPATAPAGSDEDAGQQQQRSSE